MTEKVLLNSGYKQFKDHARIQQDCDNFYQKVLSKNPTKCINVYYYDKFKDDGGLDYDFEYEYIEERHGYWYKTYIWGLDKDIPYTIEDIENILINGDLNEK